MDGPTHSSARDSADSELGATSVVAARVSESEQPPAKEDTLEPAAELKEDTLKPPAAELGPAERAFHRFGWALGAKPWLVLLAVGALVAALGSGMFVASKSDTDLFGSLVLRPGSRLERESKNTKKRLEEGYDLGSEATNGRATRGGKNVLTRKNMKQAIDFFRAKDVGNVGISYRGVDYTAMDVIRLTGPQFYRHTILDCFQEGSYDFFATLDALGAGQLAGLADEMLVPFGGTPGGQHYTPYDWCLYARLAVVYTPVPDMDAHRFGDCRQFVDGEAASETHAALEKAYEFHRHYADYYVRSAPSLTLSWGCRPPFRDQPPGLCHEAFTCCEVSQIYSACAACELLGDAACAQFGTEARPVSSAACAGVYAPLLNATSWNANPAFDPAVAARPPCAAFDFYPMSSAFGAEVGMAASYPPTTDLAGCPTAVDDALTRALVEDVACRFQPGAPSTCAATATGADYAWELLGPNLATEDEIYETGAQINKPCHMWDGGDKGLNVLPSVSPELTLGDLKNRGAKALQVVYVSNGYDAVKDRLAAKGVSVSSNAAEHGRIQFLNKWGRHLKGRHDGGSMLFGTYTSVDIEETIKEATLPETWLIILGYALILLYALTVFGVRTTVAEHRNFTVKAIADHARAPHPCDKLKAASAGVLLGLGGILCVFLGAAAGVGLGLYAGLKYNATSVQVLPFLLLGLGINDLFVMFYRFLEVDAADRGPAAGKPRRIVAGVLSTAGMTIMISSACNITAFGIAEAVNMRLVSQFAHMAACGLAGTFLVIFFGFSAMLALYTAHKTPADADKPAPDEEAKEAAPGDARPAFKKRQSSVARAMAAAETGHHAFTRGVTSTPCKFAVLAVAAAGLVAISVTGMERLTMGLPISAIFEEGSSGNIFWETKDAELSTQYFYVVTDTSDWAYKHPLIASPADPSRYSLFQQVDASDNVIDGTAQWYSIFVQWLLPCSWASFSDGDPSWPAAEVRKRCAESEWYKLTGGAAFYNPRCSPGDLFGVPPGSCGPRVSTKTLGAAEFQLAPVKQGMALDPANGLASGDVPACSAWPVQTFLCDGAPCFQDQLPADLWADITASPPRTSVLGIHPDYFYECLNLFLNYDSAHGLANPGWNCETPEDPTQRTACSAVPPDGATIARKIWRGAGGAADMDFTRSLTWAADLKTGADWVDTIDSVRRRMNSFVATTDADAYPTGKLWKFYSQYRWLGKRVLRGVGLSLVAIFAIVTVAFSAGCPEARGSAAVRVAKAGWIALMLCAAVAVSVLLLVALMGLSGLLLNCFTACTIIMAIGIAVEFLVHTSYEHLRSAGDGREDKAFEAFQMYLNPILDGALTSFLGFLCLAFARYKYIQLYYFQVYALIIAIGLFVGVFAYPATLATVGPS